MTAVTVDELRSIQDRNDDLLLVNTLSTESFKKTKIPGAINVPQDRPDFVDRIREEAGSLERPIVVYCATTECDSSSQAAQKLEDAGFKSVFDFEGGYEAWKQQREVAPAHASASGR